MNKVHERDYYTIAEAAEVLHVSPSTVWRWIKAKRLPAYRVGPRKIRIERQALASVVAPAAQEDSSSPNPKKSLIEQWREQEPPSEEELARRRALYDEIMALREQLSISPMTTADLLRIVREEREERYRSWIGQEPSS